MKVHEKIKFHREKRVFHRTILPIDLELSNLNIVEEKMDKQNSVLMRSPKLLKF
jgi:hypothetical protein